MLRFVVASGLVTLAAGAIASPTSAQESKIVGEWRQSKGDLPAGSLVEFTEGGKLRITAVPEDKEAIPSLWEYRLDENTLATSVKYGDREIKDKLTIQKITDQELVIRDAEGRVTTLQRGRSQPRGERVWSAAARAGNYKFHIKNETATPPGVWIVMDTNRERHRINPGATVIFQNANKLDNPTFRVYTVKSDGEPGDLLFTDTFFANLNPFSWSRHLVWNGSKLTDED